MTRPEGVAEPDRSVFAEVNRTRLRVWEWGDPEAPVVLALHGAYDHGRMFDELAPRVAAMGFHVRAVDLRGHGESGPIQSGHTFEASVPDIGVLALDADEPVGLLAHSMGASMAFQVAATWPEAVAWVVSLDGLGPPSEAFERPPLAEAAPAMFDAAVKTFSRGRRVFPDAAAMAAQRGAINTRLPTPWLSHLVDKGSSAVDGGRVWKWDPVFNTYLPTGFSPASATADLSAVQCPVLLLTGAEEDMWTFPADQVAERVALFSTATHVAVAGAGHYVHLEQPDVVLSNIEAFLASIAAEPMP